MTTNNGGPAFPQFDVVVGERDGHGDPLEAYTSATGGMSLRDWFAGQTLAASGCGLNEGEVQWFEQHGAKFLYRIADAMLAAREATE